MNGAPIKVMYHAPLLKGRTHEAFRRRWIQHGELAMSLPMWRHIIRYQQFDTLTPGEHHLPAQLDDVLLATKRFGGVGAVWIRDREALAAVLNDPDVAVICRDEVDTFGRELGSSLVPCHPELVVAPTAETTVSMFGTVYRQPSIDRPEFAAAWRDHGRRFAADPAVTRHIVYYIQNHALLEAEGADGFVEIGFTSLESLAEFLNEPTIGGDLADREAQFLRPEALDLLICRERCVFDRAGSDDATAMITEVRS